MSKKTSKTANANDFEKILANALDALADKAQLKLGCAGMARSEMLKADNGEIEITGEWLRKFAEVHIDIGAASAILHTTRALRKIFDLKDPFAEFEQEGQGNTDADREHTETDETQVQ